YALQERSSHANVSNRPKQPSVHLLRSRKRRAGFGTWTNLAIPCRSAQSPGHRLSHHAKSENNLAGDREFIGGPRVPPPQITPIIHMDRYRHELFPKAA